MTEPERVLGMLDDVRGIEGLEARRRALAAFYYRVHRGEEAGLSEAEVAGRADLPREVVAEARRRGQRSRRPRDA